MDTEARYREQKPGIAYREQELRLGVACFVEWRRNRDPQELWIQFDTAPSFWHHLYGMLKPKRPTWLVCHNSIYDVTLLELWRELEVKNLRATAHGRLHKRRNENGKGAVRDWQGLIAIDGIPFHMELLHNNGRLNVSDLMNYYPIALEKIGESVGCSKLPFPELGAQDADWFAYCKNDVEILKRAYLGLLEEWSASDNGNWKMSAAGLAWNNYRHSRDCSDIIVHNHGNARELERESFYGGECRAWFRGTVPNRVVHLDVNSLYPSVMAANEFPVELVDYVVCPHLPMAEAISERYAAIADLTMDNICDDIPKRQDGRIVYPVGAFRTRLAGPELTACFKGGCVHAIHSLAYYKKSNIFRDYVARWFNDKTDARDNSNPAREQFCKLMLNSLFGKFCQKQRIWQTDPAVEAMRPWQVWPHQDDATGTVYAARSIGYTTQLAKNDKYCAHTFVAIAAYVTSYARQRMQFLRKDIPPTCLYYQDTDSLFVDYEWYMDYGRWELDIGSGLGQLREVATYAEVKIRGPKNYTADGVNHISGVRRRDKPIAECTFIGERMERTAQIIGRPPDGSVRVWERILEVPGTSREGGYGPSGWSVPAVLGLTSNAKLVH